MTHRTATIARPYSAERAASKLAADNRHLVALLSDVRAECEYRNGLTALTILDMLKD